MRMVLKIMQTKNCINEVDDGDIKHVGYLTLWVLALQIG